jgi:hypothetical protein
VGFLCDCYKASMSLLSRETVINLSKNIGNQRRVCYDGSIQSALIAKATLKGRSHLCLITSSFAASVKITPLPGLMLIAFLLPLSAHAGTWKLVYTATGTETTTPFDPNPSNTFADTATGTNSVSNTKGWSTGFGIPGNVSTSMTITVTLTGT